jgi:hypothetical protein
MKNMAGFDAIFRFTPTETLVRAAKTRAVQM